MFDEHAKTDGNAGKPLKESPCLKKQQSSLEIGSTEAR